MTSFKFSDLSLDLKFLIISYISRPTDLKSLCLTSRDIPDVAVRKLYRKVFLDIEGAKAIRVSGFLARDNPGIPHVRDVTVYFLIFSDANERAAQLKQAHFVVCLLLEILPPNSFEAFRWRTWEPFSAENFFLLFEKQKHLQTVKIGQTESGVMEGIRQKPEIFTSLQRVRVVTLEPASVDSLEVSQKLLQTFTKLNLLRICPVFHIIGASAPDDSHDSSTGPGYISRTLFSHMRPFEKCTPLALKMLRFDRINLRYVSNSYVRVINKPALEDLSIWKCPGADALFAELSKPHLRPSHLKTLRFYHHDDDKHYGTGVLESFLQSTSGLVTLRIDISNAKELPKDDCITKHSASLESLSIYASKTDTDVFWYSTGPMSRICSTCRGLRQLSITSPPKSFLHAYGNGDFEIFMTSLYTFPHLRTLNLRAWPTFESNDLLFDFHGGQLEPDVFPIYTHLLQRIAQRIFDRSDHQPTLSTPPSNATDHLKRTSKLNVVAFGSNGTSRATGLI